MYDEEAVQRRLAREAHENYLGRLGNPDDPNVAKVEVTWAFEDPGLGFETRSEEHSGHFIVHAGEAPEDGSIYDVFDELVAEAMDKRQEKLGFASWQTDNTDAA